MRLLAGADSDYEQAEEQFWGLPHGPRPHDQESDTDSNADRVD